MSQELLGDRLLCSGNFAPWKARIDLFLTALDFPGTANARPRQGSARFAQWQACSVLATRIISSLVSPEILSNVKASVPNDHLELLQALEALTVRFRFMGLPPELRNRIYNHVCAAVKGIFVSTSKRMVTGYPHIVAVSRQVRSESLPIIYSSCQFNVSAGLPLSPGFNVLKTPDWTSSETRSWARGLSTGHLKYMRRFGFSFYAKSSAKPRSMDQVTLELEFSAILGLRVGAGEDMRELTRGSQALLMQHISEVEEYRKLLGLKGESIIMAITTKGKIWEYGTLQCQ